MNADGLDRRTSRVPRYRVSDDLGVLIDGEFRKLPHALRAGRKRARLWGRHIYVSNGSTVWVIRPDCQITRVPPR